METNRKRAKTHLLPTDKSMIAIVKESGLPQLFNKEIVHSKALRPVYLYITTDEEIQEGDWKLINTLGMELSMPVQHKNGIDYFNQKKIIATTDLLKLYLPTNEFGASQVEEYVPQPSQAFIEKYCKVGGMDEVDVEYELPAIPYKRGANARNIERIAHHSVFGWIPKVNSNNEITIYPIKDSWTRDEVLQIIDETTKVAKLTDWETDEEDVETLVRKRIKDNL